MLRLYFRDTIVHLAYLISEKKKPQDKYHWTISNFLYKLELSQMDK